MTVVSCLSQVLRRTRAELLPLVEAMHNLFFPPIDSLVPSPTTTPRRHSTGRSYRTDVSVAEFSEVLNNWYALTINKELPTGLI